MVSKGMASTSCLKQGSVPMNNICITPETTYEAVVADPKLFMSTLERLHSLLGTKYMVPIIGGRDLDLHKLFVEVTSRGGINKILHERRWKEVTATFVFPPTATNASYVLRKYYFSLLNNYEQVYFFRSNGQISPDSLQSPSVRPGLMLGTIRPSQELQALNFIPQQKIDYGEFPRGSVANSNVIGVIDGKFEDGYLVAVTVGSEQLKGVLYHLLPLNTVAQQTPQQTHGVFPNTWNNNANLLGVTAGVTKRRRRRKSEIKRRDPAHPKPNRSGYNFFFAEQHARLKPLHPGKDREISKMIGELWNKLNEQEKSVYQGKAREDKERYRVEMEEYNEKLKTGGQLISNAVPLQQRLPEQNVDLAEADLPIEEADEEDEEGDSSGHSCESERHDYQNGESDPQLEEPSLNPSGLNLNPNPNEMVAAPKDKTGDVVKETSPIKKADERPWRRRPLVSRTEDSSIFRISQVRSETKKEDRAPVRLLVAQN